MLDYGQVRFECAGELVAMAVVSQLQVPVMWSTIENEDIANVTNQAIVTLNMCP